MDFCQSVQNETIRKLFTHCVHVNNVTFSALAAIFLTCFTCWLRRLLSKKRTSKDGEELSEGSDGKKKRRKAEVVVIFPYAFFCYRVFSISAFLKDLQRRN